MVRRCLLLLRRAYPSEGGILPTVSAADVSASVASPQPGTHPSEETSQRPRRPPLFSSLSSSEGSKPEIDALRTELAAAQLRIAELQLSQLALHEALLRRLEKTDRAAHKTATELRYTALALQCNYDLLETELRRVLALRPHSSTTVGEGCSEEEDMESLRRAAIEAAAREMVRKNIGFRLERVSEEPATVSRATGDVNR
ncbi:hypothetical protein TraAM80_06361 [Trypanosoma rangeli]|uniref:Uncharacterized protein n=1 Tax=Trypanosoma rangeli TaxID=5698 RepID=A0A3R7MH71_TRYRA|nr:uncharacterized protein TraAM80_06361 [Trypanosoma rangeli]RNF02455.1 hypothetical protein TraAM80_06361 [Trypanosoma rangeli]|eukprot:RNF02455.1 hypothetical protein TraAM80_06361 [Trypanosoma rangeli]